MITEGYAGLITPALLIVFGLLIRFSNNKKLSGERKWWLFFVIGGTCMFVLRLIKLL